ncbi:MAG TPA: glycosyltransferase [Gemmatimonadales bacterium]|nr:glycosyltransferase [Gemmatimonadales bacterium]
MVILHVVAPAEFGGLERVVQTLGTGLQGLGHEVHVAAVVADAADGAPFLAPLIEAGVHTHRIVVSGRAYRRERAAVAGLCQRLRPDAVHTHGYRPDVIDAGVARQFGVPVLTTAHGFTGGPLRNRVYEYLQRRAFRRFDAVVAVSRALTDQLARAGVPRSRIHTVPNVWRRNAPALGRATARRLLGLPLEGFVVGWVGRLSSEKGADVLLDALPRLNNVPLTVSVVGNGVQQLALQMRAAELGVTDRVRWHGVVPEADRVFPAFDVCVLSSRTEGTPMVLFEAMAAGVPVVATDVGGVPDVVSHEEAVVVRAEDSAALAAGITDVYEHTAAAARRAGAARARLEREFAVGPWLDRYESIYRLVSRGASTPAAA